MTMEALSAAAGVMLSLGMAYLPGVSEWYTALDGVRKRLVMLALLTAAALGAYGLACSGWTLPDGWTNPSGWLSLSCDQPGLLALVEAWLAALVTNQSAYLVMVRRSEVKAAPWERRG